LIRTLTLPLLMLTAGCAQDTGAGRSSAPPPAAHPIAGVPAHGESPRGGVASVLALWDAGNAKAALSQLLAIDTDADLRAFGISERQYASLPAQDRDSLLPQLLNTSASLRALGQAAITEGEAVAKAGNRSQARHWFEAVRRLGQANTGGADQIIILGNATGVALVQRADKALAALKEE